MLSLVQLEHPEHGRAVAVVHGNALELLDGVRSTYALAMQAAVRPCRLAELVAQQRIARRIDYDVIYAGQSDWSMLPAFDHPDEPARCLVSGTGLTHVASARGRQSMHGAESTDEPVTDSMRMFRWGVEGGRPAAGRIGVQPEWFYKGDGSVLHGHGQPVLVPMFSDDGGEEPEIAGAYIVDAEGGPWRVGMMIGNEFADHEMERKNYLYLAPSKLRPCCIGPELIVDAPFDDVKGSVCIERGGQTLWSADIATGEANMSHSLANLEHHLFKYPQHRRPGDAHVHFYGADAFSFASGVRLRRGDEMVIAWIGFGRPLRNPIQFETSEPTLVSVGQL